MTNDVPSSLSLMVMQAEIAVLSDPAAMTAAEAARLVDLIEAMKRRLREINDQCQNVLMEYVKQHGDLEVGDTRYYIGNDNKTECKGNEAVLTALLQHCDGDVAQVAGFLASGAWKHGAIKKHLGDDTFGELFAVYPKVDVKTGKPLKRLKQANGFTQGVSDAQE